MTAALLRWWTVPRLNSHSNPSSTGESSTAKKQVRTLISLQLYFFPFTGSRWFIWSASEWSSSSKMFWNWPASDPGSNSCRSWSPPCTAPSPSSSTFWPSTKSSWRTETKTGAMRLYQLIEKIIRRKWSENWSEEVVEKKLSRIGRFILKQGSFLTSFFDQFFIRRKVIQKIRWILFSTFWNGTKKVR